MTQRQRGLYIAATLIGAVFVLTYRGVGWRFVRAHVGDWLVVQFMYLIGRCWIADRWRWLWAGVILLIGGLVEVIKFFAAGSIPHTFLAEMIIGSTFDPLDMIAFALGLLTVLWVERLLVRRALEMG